MKVITLQNVKQLGTSLALSVGTIYDAIPATNLPEPNKVFVYPTAQDKATGDSIALTLGSEVELVHEIINTVPKDRMVVSFVTAEVANYALDVLPPAYTASVIRGDLMLSYFAMGEAVTHDKFSNPVYMHFVRISSTSNKQGKEIWCALTATEGQMTRLTKCPEAWNNPLAHDDLLRQMVR